MRRDYRIWQETHFSLSTCTCTTAPPLPIRPGLLVPDDGLQLPDLVVHGQELELDSHRRRRPRRGRSGEGAPVAAAAGAIAAAAAVRAGAGAAAAAGLARAGIGEAELMPGTAAPSRYRLPLGRLVLLWWPLPGSVRRAHPLVVARHRLHAPERRRPQHHTTRRPDTTGRPSRRRHALTELCLSQPLAQALTSSTHWLMLLVAAVATPQPRAHLPSHASFSLRAWLAGCEGCV